MTPLWLDAQWPVPVFPSEAKSENSPVNNASHTHLRRSRFVNPESEPDPIVWNNPNPFEDSVGFPAMQPLPDPGMYYDKLQAPRVTVPDLKL